MKRTTLYIFLLLTAVQSLAQEEFVDPPSKELTKISFVQYTGGVIVFKALLEHYEDSLHFILDTGSGGISLDSSTVSELGMQQPEPERMIRGIGGITKVGFLKNKKLRINEMVVDSLNFHVVDYEILSALYGQKIDGIVGYALLKKFIVKIDYEKQEMSFWSNGSIKYPKGGYLMRPHLNTIPFSSAEIKDASKRRFHYLFDIGAGLTALFSKAFMEDSAFLKTKRKRYLKQGEGMGGKVQFHLSVMKELKIGPYKFRNVPINIFDDDYNVTSYPSYGGLIGNDIFRRFNCILNYNKRQIYVTPNKYFNEPFDYAYSGIELYHFDNRVLIGDIPKASPADKAGLLAGDQVIAVNKKFGLTLNDLKIALQATYGPTDILIKRNDTLMTKKMKIINILTGKAIGNQTLSNEFRDGIKIQIRNGTDPLIKPPSINY